MTYDENGLRLTKYDSATDMDYSYYYRDNRLVRMTFNNDDVSGSQSFHYDAEGNPLSVDYLIEYWGYWDENGNRVDLNECYYIDTYYYVTNIQGDVIALTDQFGRLLAEYTYDAWGNILDTVYYNDAQYYATYNPFRYRGYVYDIETGLYYVSSRYYDPEIGRWISPEPNVDYGEFDEGAGLLGYNVYAYCANNPVMFKDETGESITLACVLIGAGIGLIVGAVGGSHYAKHKKNLTPSDGWDYWKYVVGFGVAGGAVGALVGWGAGALIAKYGVATAATSITKGGGARFSSFNALKRSLGSAGKGKQWHHIVEQCQIGKSGFSKYWIQNSNNVINISNSVHSKVSAYYNSVHRFTNGMRFRDWLSGQSFKTQYEWGIKVLRMYGVKI